MRVGILSDIHGNIEALEKILEEFESLGGVDKFVCLGDTVGYGADPDTCCTVVRELCDFTLLGNHDAAVAGRMDYSYYYDAAREALDWCEKQLSSENMDWLKKLPYTQREDDTLYCHGSPLNPAEYDYIFATDQARELLMMRDELPQATFIGHSHLTKIFALTDDDAMDVVAPKFRMNDEMRYIVTVGSVGQPRDYDPRACAGLYDTEKSEFSYVRVEYDVEAQMRKIIDSGLAQNFGMRLLIGV
jgi:diadenosine tetraphosphatase ApaH/serine/threonine PP2A family protein phosphatase